jgi:hypothetical protein
LGIELREILYFFLERIEKCRNIIRSNDGIKITVNTFVITERNVDI